MAKIIAVANQKGGVGKTTSCVNLAAAIAADKKTRILLIDLDPQGNATMASGIDKFAVDATMNDVLLEKVSFDKIIVKTAAHYEIAPANHDLTEAEILLVKQEARERKLFFALQNNDREYDFIFIDCPPSLNILTLNALVSADSVLIPMQCEYFALEGLASLMNTINQVRGSSNANLKVEGLIRTMFDKRNRLSIEVTEQLIEHFGDRVYKTAIPRNVRLAEAPSHGQPIILYDEKSPGADAYKAFAQEFLRKQKR